MNLYNNLTKKDRNFGYLNSVLDFNKTKPQNRLFAEAGKEARKKGIKKLFSFSF
jgi:hypothetical protein